MSNVSRNCGWLTLATLALWVLAVGPANMLAGVRGIQGMTIAAVLCLVPGWLVFWFVSRYGVSQTRAVALLAGTGLRLLFVLAGVLVMQTWQRWGMTDFLVWLGLFYFTTLAIETFLVVRRTS